MRTVDGRDGGGQVLRTGLTLSILTGTPVRFERVRGARPTPGLRPQHLAGVDVAAAVSGAAVEGAELGSTRLTFRPDSLRPGDYEYDIGTAGSVTLLFETLLPLATALDAPLSLTARGGTDVKWAPTLDYLRRAKLPLLRRVGFDAGVDRDRTGFYPAGGGRATLRLRPSALSRFDLTDRGAVESVHIYSTASRSLESNRVADRQATAASARLGDAAVPHRVERVDYVSASSPGSSLLLEARYEHAVAGFDALGERGKPSERVAEEAVDAFERFTESRAVVDEHMADQLLVFVALAGGRVLIPVVTDHVRTNHEVVRAFGFDLDVAETDAGIVVESSGSDLVDPR